jgi:hypothetical protein
MKTPPQEIGIERLTEILQTVNPKVIKSIYFDVDEVCAYVRVGYRDYLLCFESFAAVHAAVVATGIPMIYGYDGMLWEINEGIQHRQLDDFVDELKKQAAGLKSCRTEMWPDGRTKVTTKLSSCVVNAPRSMVEEAIKECHLRVISIPNKGTE